MQIICTGQFLFDCKHRYNIRSKDIFLFYDKVSENKQMSDKDKAFMKQRINYRTNITRAT